MKLYYRKLGEGPPLVILHGLLGSSDNWFTLGRRFAHSHQVILVDLRNHGRSPHGPIFNYRAMAGDILQLLHEEQFIRARIMGHSLGGKVAMTLALDTPDVVEKLVVVDMAPRAYPNTHQPLISAMAQLDFEHIHTRQEADAALAPSVPDPTLRAFLLKNLKRLYNGRYTWKVNLEAIQENLDEIYRPVSGSRPFTGPALFVRGEKSNYIQEQDLALIRQFFPAARVVTVPDAGHWVHAENPDVFFRVVHEFLTKRVSDP